MKNLKILLLSLVVFYTSAYAANTAKQADDVVAVYKKEDIKGSTVMNYFKNLANVNPTFKDKNFNELDYNTQEFLLKDYLNNRLLEDEAKQKKIESSANFQTRLNVAKKQIAIQELLSSVIQDKTKDADRVIEQRYNELVNNLKGKEEFLLKHILVLSNKEAQDIQQKLSKGENFDNLAKKFSKDTTTSSKGGEIGYVTEASINPEFKKVFSQKKNQVSSPIETNYGVHLVKWVDKRKVTIPTKDQAKPVLGDQYRQEVASNYVKSLYDKANVKVLLKNNEVEETKQEPKNGAKKSQTTKK